MGSCLTKLDEGPRPQHHGQSTPSPPAPQPVAAEPAPSQQAASPEQVSPVVDSQPSVNVDGPNGHSEGPTTPSPIQLEEPSEQESISAPAVAPSNSGQAPQGPQSEGRQQATTDGSDAMNNINSSPMGAESESSSKTLTNNWDKAKMFFSLTKPEDLLNDLHDLKYIGAGGYGKVFKAVWRSAPVAVKLVPSHSPELFKSSSYKEALLCKELCHPNIVQTYETRCAQLTQMFIDSILSATDIQLPQKSGAETNSGQPGQASYGGSQEFVSGDGFGLPSPVPDMVVMGKTLPEAAAKWKDILFTTGARAGDYLTVIIMDYCDYGSLVRPILKGMFRPISTSGSDREARVRYRALLRTAKEIAQGLEHLHHLKVVHGDLKPGNVLLKGSRVDVRGFNAQVIDFGLSHLVSSSNPQKVSKAGGTLVYAAPEVFSGKVGKAADIYSLGIILWEMVTGSQPYKDLVEGQIVLGVQQGGLRPLWPQGQLPQLQELYERCVGQDPDTRPKAKEVVQALTQIEMDLRSELKAAHKQQQAAAAAQQQAALAQLQAQQLAHQQALQAQLVAQQQQLAAVQQQQQQHAVVAAQQQAMALMQQQQQQQH